MNERIDLLERGDSFAPATARIIWNGSVNVPASGNVTLAVPGPSELSGNIFEYAQTAQALRIKQAGIIGYLVYVVCNATGVGNMNVLLRQFSPLHEWTLAVQPYYLHAGFAFAAGGTRLVNVPSGGANYQIYVVNTVGGTGSFTLQTVDIRLVYLGRR